MQGASVSQVLWKPEEGCLQDLNYLKIFQRPDFIWLFFEFKPLGLWSLNKAVLGKLPDPSKSFLKTSKLIRISVAFQGHKAAAVTLFSPFPKPSTFSSLALFFPLWNNLILYVQKWLVKNIACVGLIAPVGNYTWAEELPVTRGERIKISVTISRLRIRKFWIISCQVVECSCILDLDEQEHLQNATDSDGYQMWYHFRKKRTKFVYFVLHMLSSLLRSHSDF